jgi:heme exporter protein C
LIGRIARRRADDYNPPIMALLDLANPTRFLALVARAMPWLVLASAVLFVVTFYLIFFRAPEDYQQGQTVRIMFIHVPAAWLSMFCYTLMAISALGTLVWRHPLADVSAKAAAPIGAAFTFLCLVTGSLWGKPMWGTWWIWDARLTSELVLLVMYLGLIALWRTVEDPGRAGRAVAVMTLVGFVNIPIIKFSVDWWNTLHQPASVFRLDGPTIHPSLLVPLLISALAFTMLFLTLHMAAMRNEVLRRRVRTIRLLEAQREPVPAQAGLIAGE